ncbi:MAG: TonB-dependent receptor [Prevotella sp.]|nr:TonB-dependent receptor [Prevotella sp.]MCM1074449.1 TonB-dependent receptor [Ruminococcus sp.]
MFKRLLSIISMSAVCGSLFAASPEEKIAQKDTLLEAVVIGHINPYEEIIPAQSLNAKALEKLNSNSVADALRYFSGVQLKDYGGVGGVKTLDIRSMGTNHMGVFYDGIQLGNAQNGQIDLGKYSLDNIEEISLYNGQKSRILQPAKDFGSSGSVYISTRRPRFRDNKRYNLNVTFRAGSFGLVNPSARLEYRLSKRVSLSANAEYTYANGRYKFRYKKVFSDGTLAWDTTATRRNGDIHAFRAEAGLFGTLNSGKWMGKLYYYDSERGIPGAIVNNVWKNSQRQWDRNFFAQGTFQKQLTDRYEILAGAKYARDYMHYLNPDTTLMYINNRFNQDEIYATLAQKYALTRHWEVSLSTDYQWNHLDANLVNFAEPQRHSFLAALATALDLEHFKVQASGMGTFVWDRTRLNRKSMAKFTPAVFMSYTPWIDAGLAFRAFFKRAFRMPTFNDLYYTDIGNANLKPEFATQYNIGVDWKPTFSSGIVSYLHLSADGYHNRISDKIIAVPKGTGQYRWMMMNIGKVRIWGLDVTAQTSLMLACDITLNGGVSYTFQSAKDYSDPSDNLDAAGTYKRQIAYIPNHSGSVTAGGAWRGLDVNYSFIYVGERWDNSSNIPQNYVQPWYTHDMSLSWTQSLHSCTLKATLEINNLLNQQYEVIRNYPMPGRNYRLSLRFDI